MTNSSQICYIWNTKENICLKLMKKLHDSCYWSFIQSIQKLLPICAFTTGSDPFPASFLSSACVDRMSTVVCWTSVSNSKCKVSPPLISTALKLVHLPSSSTPRERVFSNFCPVQSKLRNQLGLEKTAKLVTCYRHLHGNAELNWSGNWNEQWNGPGQTMKYLDASLEFRVLCQLWINVNYKDCIFMFYVVFNSN